MGMGLSVDRGSWMREKRRERGWRGEGERAIGGPEEARGGREENPRIVGISIHPNIRASSANTGRPSRPSRYQIIVALCCATALYFLPVFLATPFSSHPFSLTPPPLSDRCKFHYWPTDSALNASTRVYRVLSAFIRASPNEMLVRRARLPPSSSTENGFPGKLRDYREKSEKTYISFELLFTTPSRERREKKEKKRCIWSLAVEKKKRTRNGRKDMFKELRLLFYIATI